MQQRKCLVKNMWGLVWPCRPGVSNSRCTSSNPSDLFPPQRGCVMIVLHCENCLMLSHCKRPDCCRAVCSGSTSVGLCFINLPRSAAPAPLMLRSPRDGSHWPEAIIRRSALVTPHEVALLQEKNHLSCFWIVSKASRCLMKAKTSKRFECSEAPNESVRFGLEIKIDDIIFHPDATGLFAGCVVDDLPYVN